MIDEDDEPADPCGPILAEALRSTSARAHEMVRQHVEDNDEVLSTILLGEVGRWYSSSLHEHDGDQDDAQRAAEAIAQLFVDGDDEMETAIATGFIEALPRREDPERRIVDQLPGPLREELRRMENWVPPA